MKRKLGLFLILLAAFLPVAAQIAAVKEAKNDETELRRQSFEKVWRTINEKHYDAAFGGVDWKRVREIYEPQAFAAKTSDEFHAVLRRMLGELKLSHFGIYPFAPPQEENATGDGTIGAQIKIIENQPVLYRVEKDSTAEKAGLKTGFTITQIDGKTFAAILAPLEKSFAGRSLTESYKQLYRERTLALALSGKPETSVKIEVLNAKNEPQIFDLKRSADKTEISKAVGNFPGQPVVFEAKRLNGDIGYIRFNIWVMPQMAKIRQAIRDFSDAKGIIFDLRGNPGGIGGMAAGAAGFLSSEQASLGSMTSRDGELKFIVYPQTKPFLGKIVILTDYGTASTSEVFAAGMQEIGRATVVGERSAGAVLPSVFDTLPTGAIFQYAISDYKSPKNVLIEGRGVAPDAEVKTTRADLLAGRDAQLEEAVRRILNEK